LQRADDIYPPDPEDAAILRCATAQSGRVHFPNADKLVLYLKGISVVDKTVGRSNHNVSQPCHGCINPYCREWGGPILRYSWSLSI